MNDTVIHGDALSVLRGMADNSVDAIVTDPPAGIAFMSKSWDDPNTWPLQNGGKRYTGSGNETTAIEGFAKGVNFDSSKRARDAFIAFLREVMTEALRVLKPGGHALIWALPRTSHWTATALEDAGWEIRDCVYSIFGSGFPKSLNISKAIDKHLGKKREIVGMANGTGMSSLGVMHDDEWKPQGANLPITAPATPEAAQWQGWGSALKPAVECWWLCRKPLAESSIAAQVLATGTGGLNIDATRIAGHWTSWTRKDGTISPKQGHSSPLPMNRAGDKSEHVERTPEHPQGRFPSHLLLSHSLWCVPRGTKRVRSQSGAGHHAGETRPLNNTYHLGDRTADIPYHDHGYEHVEAYDCAPDCPIAELDRQSGVSKSFKGTRPPSYGATLGVHEGWRRPAHEHYHDKPEAGYTDQGGASRYFTNFPPDDYTPFLYQSKASRAERNRGCEDLPEVEHDTTHYANNRLNDLRMDHEYSRKPQSNNHPTVKPLALMRWLIRLITPPDGIVLDPFCGSGSTCVAAIQEGKHFIGIEQDASYVAICEARIAHAQKEQGVTVQAQEYDCAPDCPVRILGEQSGERKSGAISGKQGYVQYNTGTYGANRPGSKIPREPSTGTAARYFQQFAPDLWTQDMQDAEDVFIAEGGYEGEVPA